jgi:isoquinoline 1-oxidoreductase beta subunit
MKNILARAAAAAQPEAALSTTRRSFLQLSAVAGGGLLAGFHLPVGAQAKQADASAAAPLFQPNAFVRIAPDNTVTIFVGATEMGQGASTVLPMMVAEELDADWRQVRWEQSPTAPAYRNPVYQAQLTGGSMTTSSMYESQRKAGAAVRAVLLSAAAQRWGVPAASLHTASGRVLHAASGRSASYGELASEAVGMVVPTDPPLKDPKDFKIIGKPLKRLDSQAKVDGSGIFGLDVHVPGMLTALIARSPYFGGKLVRFDATQAKAMPNVVGVFEIDNGIAVVAKDYWSAWRARRALKLEVDSTAGERISSADQRKIYESLMALNGTVAHKTGDAAAARATAARTMTADYWFPYLTHAPMEPLNIVIDYRGGDSAEAWIGTQWPDGEQQAIAQVLGLKAEQVKLNTTLAGGGFGRRASLGFDVAVPAAQLAKIVKQPIKLIWTRDQDIQGGYYRPAAYHRLTAALDAAGNIVGWTDRVAVQSLLTDTVMEAFTVSHGIDHVSVEGAADLPYAIPNVLVDLHTPRFQIPVLWMRSVGHSFNAYAVEHFLEEVLRSTGRDSYQARRALLKDKPRHLATLDTVAALANWQTPPAAGRTRGIVVHASFGSFVGTVIEVSVAADRTLTVHGVWCAIDCGIVVNPDLVKAQMESSIVFGLSSALFGEITLDKGLVQQSNFDDYPVLRMYQTPQITTSIVPSAEKPSGAGEPGVPGVAPALANAILAATGQPVRALPLSHMFRIV